MIFKHKKGQISPQVFMGIIGVVITLVALGVILSSSQLSLKNLKNVATNNIASFANQTFTFTNNSNNALTAGKLGVVPGSEAVYAVDITGQQLISSGNYTINYATSTIIFINNTPTNWYNQTARAVNVSYQYYFGSQEYNITVGSQEGIKNLSDFQPTWGTVLAVALVLLLVIGLATTLYKKMNF